VKRLVLHIGNHKTGTTSIQKSLSVYRDELNSAGYSVFSYDTNLRFTPNSGACHSIVNYTGKFIGRAEFNWQLVDLLCKSDKSTIVSTENLSWVFNGEQIEKFFQKIKKSFDDIRVIVYLRRQDRHVISHIQESSKSIAKPASVFFKRPLELLPEHDPDFDQYLDYYARLSLWSNVFGPEALTIRVFEKEKLVNGDAVSDFFSLLKITSSHIQPIQVNKSLGFFETKLGLILNKNQVPDSMRPTGLGKYESTPMRRPSRARAYEFYRVYTNSNDKVAKQFLSDDRGELFDNDFSDYPLDNEDNITSSEYIGLMGVTLKNAFNRLELFHSKKVLVIGDSHCKAFDDKQMSSVTPNILWDVIAVPGGILSNISSSQSNQVLTVYDWALYNKQYDIAVFQFGEILRSIIHLDEKGNTSSQSIDKLADSYISILSKLKKSGPVFVLNTYLLNSIDVRRTNMSDARDENVLKVSDGIIMKIKKWCKSNEVRFIDLPDTPIKKLQQHELNNKTLLRDSILLTLKTKLFPLVRQEFNRLHKK